MLGAVLLAMSIQDPVIDLDNTIATAYMLVAQIGAAPPIIQGRYELRRTLGRGANGLVCEALDRHLQRFVALKLVPLRDARTATNAAREAQTLAQFDHANIVRIHDVGQASDISGLRVDLVYVVMELLKGANLRHWAAEQRSQRAILDVFLAAGEGLALLLLAVEVCDHDLGPEGGEVAGGGLSEAGRPTGDDCADAVDLHGWELY